jgi:hypothetical protein
VHILREILDASFHIVRRFLKTVSEMRLLRHRSAFLRDMPYGICLTGYALRELLAVVGPAPSVRPGLAGGDHVQGVS